MATEFEQELAKLLLESIEQHRITLEEYRELVEEYKKLGKENTKSWFRIMCGITLVHALLAYIRGRR